MGAGAEESFGWTWVSGGNFNGTIARRGLCSET